MWRHFRNSSIFYRALRTSRSSRRGYADEPTPQTPIKRSGSRGLFWKLLGLTTVGGCGVVGYAWYDEQFRRDLERTVPYADKALSYIFKALPTEVDTITWPKLPRIPGFGSKVEAPDDSMPVFEKSSKSRTEPPPHKVSSESQSPPAVEPKKAKLSVDPPALVSKAELDKRMQAEDTAAALENAALEHLATDLMTSCDRSACIAQRRHIEAVEAINMHREQTKTAMKSGSDDAQWRLVARALDEKNEKVQTAGVEAEKAKCELEKLTRVLEDGRANSVTRTNPVIIAAQEKINKLTFAIDTAWSERNSAESSMAMMNEFRDLIERGRKQFRKELESIVPEASTGKKGQKMTEDELNALIGHAHKRIEQLQVRLAEQEALEEERLSNALDRQRQEDHLLTSEVVKHELEKKKGEDLVERQKWESVLVYQMEQDLRQQLSRQAAVHNDHLADVLRLQRRELALQYRDELREVILKERIQFQNSIAESMTRVKGIEAAVDARAQMEKTGRKAQELWLACQDLVRSLSGADDSMTQEKVSLVEEVRAVREAGNEHEFVATVVNSIPEESLVEGVHTQSALAERFKRVKKICRRVAMVDEAGGSLMKYMLSYLQSVFMLEKARAVARDDDVTPESLDAFTILSSAEKCLLDGDLEQAVRFVRQLRGEARNVAADWLADARVLLETKQAAEALLGHASACGLGSLLHTLSKDQ